MSIGEARKLDPAGTVMKVDKKVKDPVATAEAELEQKRRQAAELDEELRRKEQELAAKKQQKLDMERAEAIEEAEKREIEAEFLLSQGREAGARAVEIRRRLETMGTVGEKVGQIHQQMILEGENAGAQELPLDQEAKQETGDGKICASSPAIVWIMKNLAWLQVALLAFFLLVSWGGFKLYEAKINAYNSSLDETEIISEKINPFNDANIQRVFFEKGLEFLDLGLLFVFLIILAPTVLLYVVPFIKSPKSFSSDFNQDLTPWQRVQCVLFLVFSLLLYFGLKAVVNTF